MNKIKGATALFAILHTFVLLDVLVGDFVIVSYRLSSFRVFDGTLIIELQSEEGHVSRSKVIISCDVHNTTTTHPDDIRVYG
jgi:hypothetical protein